MLGESARAAAQTAAEALLVQLRGSPYFRDGGQLAYTLRGHVRGFLEDPSHPLAGHLLRLLAVVALEGGGAGMRHLLAWVDAACLRPSSPALAAAVAYAARRHDERLTELARGPAAQRLAALRGSPALPDATAAADRLRDHAVAAALDAWGAGPRPAGGRHSM